MGLIKAAVDAAGGVLADQWEAVNLAEMERRTGLSRSRLRRLKKNGFEFKPHANKGDV